jgi:hypothetical protein
MRSDPVLFLERGLRGGTRGLQEAQGKAVIVKWTPPLECISRRLRPDRR